MCTSFCAWYKLVSLLTYLLTYVLTYLILLRMPQDAEADNTKRVAPRAPVASRSARYHAIGWSAHGQRDVQGRLYPADSDP